MWLFKVGFTGYYNNYRKTKFWLVPHSHQSLHLMHQIFPKAKMRSRFIILYQPSLNDLLFIFSPPLLYKSSLSFISVHTKNLISSLLLSSNEVESPHPPYGSCMKVYSHSLIVCLCCHDVNLRLKHDSNYLNFTEYVWMLLIVLIYSSHVLGCSSHVHA